MPPSSHRRHRLTRRRHSQRHSRNLRNQGVNGLVLAPQDSKQMVPAVEQCVEDSIPVVVIDSGLDKDVLKKKPDLVVKYVATDNYHGGQLAAEKLVALANDRGGGDNISVQLIRIRGVERMGMYRGRPYKLY